ncbi:MAG: YadA C-terminal domain-containing protein, partial [Pseudomonadota bacterium]|nr:YadA C-terminal domain-containing protein [Pseudomonadota bacterium]
FFLNAVAIGLFAATSASATVNVVTNVRGSTLGTIEQTKTSIYTTDEIDTKLGTKANAADVYTKTESVAAARTAVQGDLNNTSSAIYSAVKAEAIKEIADNIRNTTYSDGKYDASNSAYRTDSASSLSVTDGTPAVDEYQFTLGGTKTTYKDNGTSGSINTSDEYVAGNMNTGLISVNSDALTALNNATAADLTGRTGYGTYTDQIARNDSQLYTQKTTEGSGYKFQLGATATDDPTVSAALGSTEGLAFFKYTDNHTGTAETITLKSLLDAEKLAKGDNGLLVLDDTTHLNKADYTFALSTIDPTKGGRDGDATIGNVSDGVDVTKYYYWDGSNKVYFTTETEMGDVVGNDAALAVFLKYGEDSAAYKGDGTGGALGQYNADDTDYRKAIENYNTERAAFNTLVDAYDNANSGYSKALTAAEDAYNTANADYRKADEAFLRDTVAYNKENGEYTAYSSSVQIAVDERADAAITRGLDEGGAIRTAVTEGITDLITTKEGLLSQDIGYNLADPDNADTGLVARLEALTDESADKTLVGAINANTAAIAGLKTEAETIFADKQQWVDETLGITSANPDAVKNEYTGTNYLANAETLTAADKALDTQIKTNADAIAVLKGDEGAAGSVKTIAKGYADTAESNAKAYTDQLANGAVATNTAAIATLNGAEGAAGSVKTIAKGYADTAETNAKGYTDGLLGTGFDTTNTVRAAIDAEVKNRQDAIADVNKAITDEATARTTAIGNLTGVEGDYLADTTTSTPAIADHLNAISANLEEMLGSKADLEAVLNSGAAAGNTLAGYLQQQATSAANTQAANEANFARLDSKINKLETKLEKGLAANNALAGLVPLDHVHKTQISAALGGYKYNQALAVGAFHYINDRTLLNAGAAYGGNDSLSYKVGVTFGF